MFDVSKMTQKLPISMRRRLEPVLEAVNIMTQVKSIGAVASMLPSMVRGFGLRQGRQGRPTEMISGHRALFDWDYHFDKPEMRVLYQRAKDNQWDAERALDWSIDVDPLNPEVPLLPEYFLNMEPVVSRFKLSVKERRQLVYSVSAWMLSQFLHGEQGALYASAQVTESVQWFDGKLYGATQVMDEGRHVEAFHRYLDEKLNKIYVVNDNLFTIIDALMTDSRWDMKFLGMQIMVEGLALGAFGALYRMTHEPLLKNMLRYIIQDEARHVHYGVLALGDHFRNNLSDAERKEREDWAFEIALLMRNRFMAYEVYEEWFEGGMTRREWENLINTSPGMRVFRQVMFNRLIPNLRSIGLLSDRVRQHYEDAGLYHFASGADATQLSGEQMIAELDQAQSMESLASGEHDHHHDDEPAPPPGAVSLSVQSAA